MGKWCMYIERFQVYMVSIVLQLNASVHFYIDASTYFYILHSKQCTERFINEFGHSYHCHCVSPSSVQTYCCLDSICRQGILQDRSTSFFMVEEWIMKGEDSHWFIPWSRSRICYFPWCKTTQLSHIMNITDFDRSLNDLLWTNNRIITIIFNTLDVCIGTD